MVPDLSKYLGGYSPYINHKNEYQVVCHGIAPELSLGGLGGFLRMCLLKADLGLTALSVALSPLTQVPVGP